MLPLTRDSAASFHDARLPGNVYVADASLFPESLGNPPILTIVAMAKRIGRLLSGDIDGRGGDPDATCCGHQHGPWCWWPRMAAGAVR
jgi:GMC oxidoreductase